MRVISATTGGNSAEPSWAPTTGGAYQTPAGQNVPQGKDGGKFIIQHSCGDIHELFPDLIDIGLDCYQTFQPEIYDIEAVKKNLAVISLSSGEFPPNSFFPPLPRKW